MTLVQNFPFFSIILSMFCGIISFALKGKQAKYLHLAMLMAVLIMSLAVLGYTLSEQTSYTFSMGHFPAPWGNEIRIGVLEALLATAFCVIMLLSVLGGIDRIDTDIQPSKQHLFFVMLDLLMSALLVLIYTNDMFTAYVFIEILTIAACGIIMIKKQGRSYVSALKYMIMSLVGSGLFLLGLTLLYCITGHLLMSPIHEALTEILADAQYHLPVIIVVSLMTVGLAIKSGLYPFHTWIPDAYAYSTPAASAVLSSLVSKGYIILVIKIFYRVLGTDAEAVRAVFGILFVFGLIAMIMGSADAIQQKGIYRMVAYSSVAQIGYIYMGIGLGTTAGMVAAVFHVISHGIMKSLLFLSAARLMEASGGKGDFESLRGAAHRNKLAGLAFSIGSLSMVGIPLFCGFISKYLFATAATTFDARMILAWTVLGISTVLNAVYFLHTVLTIYKPAETPAEAPAAVAMRPAPAEDGALVVLSVLHVALGVGSVAVISAIELGLALLA